MDTFDQNILMSVQQGSVVRLLYHDKENSCLDHLELTVLSAKLQSGFCVKNTTTEYEIARHQVARSGQKPLR